MVISGGRVKLLSVSKFSFGLRTTSASKVGTSVVSHVARSAVAVRKPTLIFATERGFREVSRKRGVYKWIIR